MLRRTFTYILLAGSLSPVQGAELLSLRDSIREALAANPEILAAKKASEAASARILQAAALKDPLLELEYDRINADRDLSGHPMTMYAISQEVPFPTKLYYRAKIASRLARMAYETYQAKERGIIAQVKSAYADLFLVYKSIDITRENKSILEQFSSTATTRYSTGKGTQADALKAQVELAKIENELIMLEQKRLTSQARLDVLLNRDPSMGIAIPMYTITITRTPTLDELYTLAKNSNPELKAYHYGIERGEAALKLSVNEFMPDLMVQFKQMVAHGDLQGGMWAGTLGITLPLWFLQKQVFGVKEMKSELDMVKAEYQMKQNMVLFEVRDSYARAEANRKISDLYKTSFIPQAGETVKATLKGYESGTGDFLTLLDSQRMLTDFRIEEYKAAIGLTIAVADLEKAVGIEIPNPKSQIPNPPSASLRTSASQIPKQN